MAVTCWILDKIVLMIFLCLEEVLQWLEFHEQGLSKHVLLTLEFGLDDWKVVLVGIVHAGPVSCSFILALLVEA